LESRGQGTGEQEAGSREEATSSALSPVPSALAAKRALFWGSFVGLLIVDQWVKAWVRNNLRLEESRAWWPNVFELRRTYNEGIAFGLLSGKGVLLTPVAVIIAAGAVWYVYRHPKESRWNHVAFGLLASGAVGNLYDRVVMKQVTDMFFFRAINFPVFNVADACITVATIMLMIGWWRESMDKGKAATTTETRRSSEG
jgi:signal peptidase II